MKDLRTLPLDRFCNFVWWWWTKDAPDSTEVAKIRARLWVPPKGIAPTTGPWSPEAETAAFKALSTSLNK